MVETGANQRDFCQLWQPGSRPTVDRSNIRREMEISVLRVKPPNF